MNTEDIACSVAKSDGLGLDENSLVDKLRFLARFKRDNMKPNIQLILIQSMTLNFITKRLTQEDCWKMPYLEITQGSFESNPEWV